MPFGLRHNFLFDKFGCDLEIPMFELRRRAVEEEFQFFEPEEIVEENKSGELLLGGSLYVLKFLHGCDSIHVLL